MAWALEELLAVGLPLFGGAAAADASERGNASGSCPAGAPPDARPAITPAVAAPLATSSSAAGDPAVREVEDQMAQRAAALGLSSVKFLAVEPGYYDQPLEWRRDRLGAGDVEELCKSVVLENTKLGAGAEVGRVRCVLVLVQYIAKLNKEKLIKAVQAIETARGLPALGNKQYNMRLLEGQTCAELTGFEHNAVTPLGLDLPMVLSDRIAGLPAGQFWLGGGHVDLKLLLSVAEAVEKLQALVADVTT